MDFDFRFGESDDIPVIRDFVLEAGAGIFEFMLDGILPGVKARHLLKLAVAEESANLAFSNALLAETADGRVAAVALCYPAETYGLPPEVRSIVPRKRLAALDDLFTTRVDNTLYLNTLAVADWARSQGLAKMLLSLVMNWAVEQGLNGVSLHAWQDYEASMRLYRGFGFQMVRDVAVPEAKQFRHRGPMALLHAPPPVEQTP